MNHSYAYIVCVVVFLLSTSATGENKTDSSLSKYSPPTKYDSRRDGEADIKEALLEAQRTGKHLLIDVGGEWCIWCHILDKFFDQHPKLLEYREQNFVMVKINYSRENENKKLLSRYPKIAGFPHLFVLDKDGKLLHSQDTSQLEEGKSYNVEKVWSFLRKWALQK
jgi:thioredoxin-related protein